MGETTGAQALEREPEMKGVERWLAFVKTAHHALEDLLLDDAFREFVAEKVIEPAFYLEVLETAVYCLYSLKQHLYDAIEDRRAAEPKGKAGG